MAVCKIKAIRTASHMKTACEYAGTEEKTAGSLSGGPADIERAFEYVVDPDKTQKDEVLFVSSLNIIDLNHAADQMAATRKDLAVTKEGDRIGYHLIQSFSPTDNVSPETAHEIGVRFAQAICGDHEAVIGTHLDRAHTHNHIVFNAVSLKDGKRFHMEKGYVTNTLMRVSNELCHEYGLSTINWQMDKESVLAKAWQDRHWDARSYKEAINRDIRSVANRASSMTDFLVKLEDLGYMADVSGKHFKVMPPGGSRAWRLDRFYAEDELQQMFSGEADKAVRGSDASFRGKVLKSGSRAGYLYRPLTRFEYETLRFAKMLGAALNTRRPPYIPSAALKKASQNIAQLRYLARSGIDSNSKLSDRLGQIDDELKALRREQYRLRGRSIKFSKLFEAAVMVKTYDRLGKSFKDGLDKADLEEYEAAVKVVKTSGLSDTEIREERARIKEEQLGVRGRIMSCREEQAMIYDIADTRSIKVKAISAERSEKRGREVERKRTEQKRTRGQGRAL